MKIEVRALEMTVQVRLGWFDAEGNCVKTVLQPAAVLFHPHGAGAGHYVEERVKEARGELITEARGGTSPGGDG